LFVCWFWEAKADFGLSESECWVSKSILVVKECINVRMEKVWNVWIVLSMSKDWWSTWIPNCGCNKCVAVSKLHVLCSQPVAADGKSRIHSSCSFLLACLLTPGLVFCLPCRSINCNNIIGFQTMTHPSIDICMLKWVWEYVGSPAHLNRGY
jgi:hypothetical protein